MMNSPVSVQIRGFELNDLESRRIDRRLQNLVSRLPEGEAEPVIDLILDWYGNQGRIRARLRVRHAPIGTQLVADASSRWADQAVRIATERVERQLKRRQALQRGEPSIRAATHRVRERSRRRRALLAKQEQPVEAFADAPSGNEVQTGRLDSNEGAASAQ